MTEKQPEAQKCSIVSRLGGGYSLAKRDCPSSREVMVVLATHAMGM